MRNSKRFGVTVTKISLKATFIGLLALSQTFLSPSAFSAPISVEGTVTVHSNLQGFSSFPFMTLASAIAYPFVATGAYVIALTESSRNGMDREVINAVVQDAADYIGSEGNRKSAMLAAVLQGWRDQAIATHIVDAEHASDLDLIMKFLDTVEQTQYSQ